ncbi:DoxX family protein [Azospirillum thermophilum]|uniref:DoxX family protein n=1 Tax=Azospirillum thermophilum TaxID=2202148 RepID=A0A2S2CZ59_9PROT|nr:DoxX family protein [Azospirillum thermophilum]AWK89725.1 DoxX family protein [Azospirillum thermophilum]
MSYDRLDTGARGGWIDRTAVGGQDLLLLAARVLLGAIFVQSGFGKLMSLGGFIGGLESQGVPMAAVLGTIGAAVEFFGGLAVVLGAWTRLAALAVAGFTVAATLIAHRYWEVAPEAMRMQQIQFMKNVAIIGGLLSLVASGGGRFAIDALLHRRP